MQPPYKIEVFDRNIDFRSFAVIPRPDIYFDYLTLEQTRITVPGTEVFKGDYIHITDGIGSVIYQGIVSDVGIRKKKHEISISPLLSLFDLTVSYDRTDLQNGALEDFVAGIITNTFIRNSDALQNIPGLSVEAATHTMNTKLNVKSNVHELYDIITKSLTMYGIVVTADIFPQSKTLSVKIARSSSPPLTLETTLDNVISKNFVIGDSFGQLNKMVLINKYDETEQATYYLHADGSVDAENRDRVTPVFLATEYVESEEFQDDAHRRAMETLSPQKFDNLIEITYRHDDAMVQPSLLNIGQIVTILDKEAYSSALTGYERQGGTIKLVFGNIRVDLTKKLILERRGL